MWTPKAGSSDDGLYRLQETTGRTTYEVWMQFLYTLFFSLLPSLMFTYKMIYRAWPAVKTIQVRMHFTGVRILQKHRFGAVSIEYRFRLIWLCSSGLYHFLYGHFLTTDTLKVFPNQKLWWKCLTLIKACIPTNLNSYWFPSIALHSTLFRLQHANTHQNDICIFYTKDHSFFSIL